MSNEAQDDDEAGQALPHSVVRRLDRLKELEEVRAGHMAQYLKERAALEAKFHEMNAALFEERAKIVKGAQEVEANHAATDDDDDTKGVPRFWVRAIGNNEDISAMLAEDDVDCLVFLENITCRDDKEGKGFTIQFYFSENPYFTNDVLSKRYEIPNLLTTDEPILKNVVGTSIDWKEGKSLTQKVVIKKQKGKGKQAGQVRTVKKTEQIESLFSWFEPPKMPSLEDMDEETAANLEVQMEMDYEVASAFRKHVVPQAVLWFTGEAGELDLEAAMEELIAANE